MNSFSSANPHLLDLSENTGSLQDRFVDLPARRAFPDLHYLRQQERSSMPMSYRSGLAFFLTIILASVFGMSAFQAQTMADSHRNSLQDQIVRSLSAMDVPLEPFATHEERDIVASFPDDSEFLHAFDEQARFIELGLEIEKGSEAFQNFLNHWKQEGYEPLERLQWMAASAEHALKSWDAALTRLQSLPLHRFSSDKRLRINQSLSLLSETKEFLSAFLSAYEPLQILLGRDQPQRVAVLIQDPHEKRATGGALSAGVELLIDEGEILSWKPFHVADFDEQAQLPTGGMGTANSFLDGKKSGEQIAWYWQREVRSSLDAVVLINSTALERFFQAVPHSFSNEHLALRWSALRLKDDRAALKAFASELIQQAAVAAQDPKWFLEGWSVLQDLKAEKQLIVVHPTADFGLSSPLPSATDHEDFLMVASINPDVNASDRWVANQVKMHTAVTPQGTIRNWLQIERKHLWESSFMSPLLQKVSDSLSSSVLQAMSSTENRNTMKVLAPKDSQLISVAGISLADVSTMHTDTHTVWSFPSIVRPGEVAVMELTYELPWSFDTQTVDNYRLRLLKQPGASPMGFEHVMKLPSSMSVFQTLPEETVTELKKDEQIAIVAGKNP